MLNDQPNWGALGLLETPSNYTKEDSTAKGHFRGIDTKLGSIDSNIEAVEGDVGVIPTGTTYTPTDTDIGGHLQGISDEFGSIYADGGDIGLDTALANIAGSPTDIDGYIGAIDTEIGTIDTAIAGKAPNDHNTTHNAGQSDEIEGDSLKSSYDPDSWNTDGVDIEDHWEGLDTRLEILEHLARNCVGGRIAYTRNTALRWESVSSNEIGLYTGSGEWVVVLDSSMPTISNTDTDMDGNALTAPSAYSVYIRYQSATSWSWEYKKWTSWTNRGAAATPFNFGGVLVAGSDADGKRCRYMGVLLTWDDSGTVSFFDGKLGRYIWNHYHQQKKAVWGGVEAATTWNYSTATWRQLNGATSYYQADFILMEDRDILLDIGQGGVGSYGSSPYDARAQVAPAFNGTSVLGNAMCDYQQYNGWYYSVSRSYIHETSGITPGRQYYNVMEKAADGLQVTLYGYSRCYVTFELEM